MSESKDNTAPAPEWSRSINIDKIDNAPVERHISAKPEERKKLARRLDIQSLENLEADINLRRSGANSMIIHVTGRFKASVTQQCVVTLEPVKSEIEEDFEAWYADPEEAISLARVRHDRELQKQGGERPILDEHEDPEPVENGQIDLGEVVTQFLSLAINPYPHAESVKFESGDDKEYSAGPTPEARKNPFAALKNWKSGGKEE